MKNSLPYIKCVLRLSSPGADSWPFYEEENVWCPKKTVWDVCSPTTILFKKIVFSNYLPLSLALNSSSEQLSPNWARFTSTPLNSALSHFRQRADGAVWTFLDKHTFLPLRVTYLFSRRSMWGNFLYFSRYKLQNYKTKLFRPPYWNRI